MNRSGRLLKKLATRDEGLGWVEALNVSDGDDKRSTGGFGTGGFAASPGDGAMLTGWEGVAGGGIGDDTTTEGGTRFPAGAELGGLIGDELLTAPGSASERLALGVLGGFLAHGGGFPVAGGLFDHD